MKTTRSARSGTKSSLKNSLIPSASVCMIPNGPARFGPIRLCMSEITLRSNQIMSITDTISAAKTTNTLTRTIRYTASPTPWA